MTCDHSWDKIHEESIIGGHYPVAWECSKCKKWVEIGAVPVTGLGGHESGVNILVGPHGGYGNCSDGSVYKRQIAYPDGRLEVVR
jgi:hypothetical protein